MRSATIKTKHWLIFAVLVLLICDWLIIAYWTDIQIDLSLALLIKMLLGIPLAIIISVYFLYWITQFSLKKFRDSSGQNSEIIDHTAESEDNGSDYDQFESILPVHAHVLASAFITPWGDDVETIMENLGNNALAEVDPILKYQTSYPYLTRRVATMPILNELESKDIKNKINRVYLTEQPLFTERAKRIEQLIAQLFKQLSIVLQSLEIKKKIVLNDDSVLSLGKMQIHPAWMGEDQHPSFELDVTQTQTPCRLQIVYLLPNHLTEIERERFAVALTHCLNSIDLDEQYQLSSQMVLVESSDDCQQHIHQCLSDYLNHDHTTDPQLLLILGADSWIDQQLLDIKFTQENKAALPSEGGFAMLLAHEGIQINLTPVARVSAPIRYKTNQTQADQTMLHAGNLEQSIQYLQKIYALEDNAQLFDPQELVLVEHAAHDIQLVIELKALMQKFNIVEEQMISIAPILNDTRAMISGLSLSYAIKYTQEKQSRTLVINNSGHQSGRSWIVSPYKNNDQVSE